jgi:uncharacterized membrane protein YphA (DoxX/SURF4 family)
MAVVFFGLALVLIGTAGWMAGAGVIYFTGVAGAALHAAWQMSLLDIDDSGRCLKLFRSNRDFGLIISSLRFSTACSGYPYEQLNRSRHGRPAARRRAQGRC